MVTPSTRGAGTPEQDMCPLAQELRIQPVVVGTGDYLKLIMIWFCCWVPAVLRSQNNSFMRWNGVWNAVVYIVTAFSMF